MSISVSWVVTSSGLYVDINVSEEHISQEISRLLETQISIAVFTTARYLTLFGDS
jgi:hypothetical protein